MSLIPFILSIYVFNGVERMYVLSITSSIEKHQSNINGTTTKRQNSSGKEILAGLLGVRGATTLFGRGYFRGVIAYGACQMVQSIGLNTLPPLVQFGYEDDTVNAFAQSVTLLASLSFLTYPVKATYAQVMMGKTYKELYADGKVISFSNAWGAVPFFIVKAACEVVLDEVAQSIVDMPVFDALPPIGLILLRSSLNVVFRQPLENLILCKHCAPQCTIAQLVKLIYAEESIFGFWYGGGITFFRNVLAGIFQGGFSQ